jgi:hypothetical protein
MAPAFGTGTRLGPRTSMQAAPQPWSPMDLGGLVLWTDMQDPRAFSLDSGRRVVQMVNKATGVAWPSPTVRALLSNAINGRFCAEWEPGSTARYFSTEAAVVASQANNAPCTVFAVVRSYQTDYAGTILGAGSVSFSSSRTKRYGYNTGGTGQYGALAVDDSGTQVNLVSTSGIVDASSHVFSFVTGGANGTILVDGRDVGATNQPYAPGTLTPTQVAIGCRPDSAPDSFMEGAIGEVLIFNRQLSSHDMLQVHAYLGEKWGIQSLSPLSPLSLVSSVSPNFFVSADVGAAGTLWSDQSGNARDFTQSLGSNFEPTIVPNSLNGKGTILFDGVDDFYQSAYVPPAPGTTPSWYFIIFRPITATTSATILGSNNTNRFRLYWANTTLMASFNGGTQLSGAVTANNWYRGALFFNNDLTDYRRIGSLTVSGSNAGNNVGNVGTYLGAINAAGAVPANVSIACVGSWAGQPTPEEQASLDLWVQSYYGPSVQL